ncbi:MAG: GNAT family N-acetyltransferase [Chthoniobacterales bacterium]
MFAPADYDLRPLTASDEPILWEMLYTGLRPAGGEEPPREIVRRPEYARYVEGWGRPGDTGFIAHDRDEKLPLGAVWLREPPEKATPPELAFVVKPGHRQHGIGASLLTQIMRANPQLSAIALRMGANSPAVRLFGRFGFEIVSQGDQAIVMQRAI